ncbi:MAG: polysaccharide biosynthesis tyrosine autokinase [Anaerolineae bacterium]|nr:polysaccharide biosynthesis tyrosine autokinase [Anaerolineae bacterium]
MKTASPLQIVFKLVLKWWWLMLIAVALGAGVGYLIRTSQPNLYFARATIWFGGDVENTIANVDAFEQINALVTIYSGLARRENILEPVINRLNLGISVPQLQERMYTSADLTLPLMEIVVADTDPVRAAEIANAIAQQLIENSPTERESEETAFKRQQLRDLASQIQTLNTQYETDVAAGADLTNAFQIAQNLQQRNATLATIRELQSLYAELSMGLGSSVNSLVLYDAATAENALVVQGSAMSIILSGVAGLAVSIATIVLIAFLDDRLQWHEGLEFVHGVKVLGPLGVIPRNKLPLYIETMPDTIESEMLRQLRAKLVLAAGGEPPRLVTVTSYDSGDGKTVTSANLALASARSGLRTLLIDGDIRKGDIHEVFRLPNVMGLTDIVSSRENVDLLLSRALLESGYDNLTVLTSGRSTADPSALVSSPRFAAVIESLKMRFDTVIMDSVPTIGGPDSAFMAELSDGVVIVIHGQRTTEKSFKRTLQTIQQGRNVNIFGMVFNRIPLQVTSSYSKPYYRRTLTISPDKLSKELLSAGKKRSLVAFNRNVMVDKNGDRLYSMAAAALQLGITEKGLRYWLDSGQLTSERRGLRRWVRESEIGLLLEKLPRYESAQNGMTEQSVKSDGLRTPNGSHAGSLPLGAREALLASARTAPDDKPEVADDQQT